MLVVALLAAAGIAFTSWRAPTSSNIPTARLERGTLVTHLDLSGELVNDRVVVLTALIDGQIRDITAREGDRVEAGEVIVRFDDAIQRVGLNRARAELERARAVARDAGENRRRAETLARDESLSAQELDEAGLALAAARADIAIARSELTLARLALDHATIRAPFAGSVIATRAEAGQWMEAGTAICTLAATRGRRIEGWVDAGSIGAIDIGQPVRLSSEAWPGRVWKSEIEWIAPAIAEDGRRRNGEVPPNAIAIRMLPGPDAPPLRLGQQVDIDVETARADAVLTVPMSAIAERDDGTDALLVLRDGRAVAVPVTVGLATPDRAEVRGVLQPGERYIRDVAGIDDGTPVAPP